MHTITA